MNIEFTDTAQEQIKLAIRFLDKTAPERTARETIKELIFDFQNQLIVRPASGRKCQYLDLDQYREMVKGEYRFVYRLDKNEDSFSITILTFCHTRMNYATLLNMSINAS